MPNGHPLFAALYDRITAGTERRGMAALRARLVGSLRGRVVEIGAGTGANLPDYGVLGELILVEPDAHMRHRLRRRIQEAPPLRVAAVTVLDASAENLPLEDASCDGAVSTLTLCSVTDPARAAAELHRVLRPGASLVLIEHVRAARRGAARLQWALDPIQQRMAAGCHLTRDTASILRRAGFDCGSLAGGPLPGMGMLGTGISGVAIRLMEP